MFVASTATGAASALSLDLRVQLVERALRRKHLCCSPTAPPPHLQPWPIPGNCLNTPLNGCTQLTQPLIAFSFYLLPARFAHQQVKKNSGCAIMTAGWLEQEWRFRAVVVQNLTMFTGIGKVEKLLENPLKLFFYYYWINSRGIIAHVQQKLAPPHWMPLILIHLSAQKLTNLNFKTVKR